MFFRHICIQNIKLDDLLLHLFLLRKFILLNFVYIRLYVKINFYYFRNSLNNKSDYILCIGSFGFCWYLFLLAKAKLPSN